MQKNVYLKVTITYKCPFNDLASLSGNPIVFTPENNLEVSIIRSVSTIENGNQEFKFSVSGCFLVNTTDKKYKEILEKFTAEQTIYPLDKNPKIAAFINENIDTCLNEVRRIIDALRWALDLSGGNHKEHLEVYYSIDKSSWYAVDMSKIIGIVGFVSRYDEINDENFKNAISKLVCDKKFEEPFYHKMIREAKDIAFTNSKGAFVLAMSALEVSIKSYISKIKPDTSWLLDNIPSPDLHKMLSQYIPQLNSEFTLPKVWLDEIKGMISVRNELVHKGKFKLDPKSVNDKIELVNDLIHLVDHFSKLLYNSKYYQSRNRLDVKAKPIIQDFKDRPQQ